MGSESILKKSVIGGFKKEGVLNYVEQLQSEIVTLRKELNECNSCKKDLDSANAKNEIAEKEIDNLRCEIEELNKKNEALEQANKALNERDAAFSLKLEEAQVTISNYENKIRLYEEKIASIEEKFAEIEKNYQKYGEVIDNAKSSAAEITVRAKNAVNNAKDEISSVNERIKTACINFESSVASMKSSAENLIETLSAISENINSEEE